MVNLGVGVGLLALSSPLTQLSSPVSIVTREIVMVDNVGSGTSRMAAAVDCGSDNAPGDLCSAQGGSLLY